MSSLSSSHRRRPLRDTMDLRLRHRHAGTVLLRRRRGIIGTVLLRRRRGIIGTDRRLRPPGTATDRRPLLRDQGTWGRRQGITVPGTWVLLPIAGRAMPRRPAGCVQAPADITAIPSGKPFCRAHGTGMDSVAFSCYRLRQS